jgi:hypothetical protein
LPKIEDYDLSRLEFSEERRPTSIVRDQTNSFSYKRHVSAIKLRH